MAAKSAISEAASALSTSGVSGPQLLQDAFGDYLETVVTEHPVSRQELGERVNNMFRKNARKFVTARGVADFDANLLAGAPVNVQGVDSMLAGQYFLTEVRHFFDTGTGARSEFIAERADLESV